MDLDFAAFGAMAPQIARDLLPGWLGSYVDPDDPGQARFQAAVLDSLAATSDDELGLMMRAFAEAGEEYRIYPAIPAARRLSRASMAQLVPGATVSGQARLLQAMAAGPTLLLCNHLSYVDTQLTDLTLAAHGAGAAADALVAVAGPKVYASPFRRIAAICLNTLKTAQSSHLSTNEVVLSPREIARIALETVQQAEQLLRSGQLPLLYAEGTRSRTGRLAPFLRGVSRYVGLPGVTVLPLAITGSERVFPIDSRTMRSANFSLRVGEPIPPGSGAPREVLTQAWRQIAALLPAEYQPLPDTLALA